MKLEITIHEGGPFEACMTTIISMPERPETKLEEDYLRAIHHFIGEEFDDEYVEKHKDYEI